MVPPHLSIHRVPRIGHNFRALGSPVEHYPPLVDRLVLPYTNSALARHRNNTPGSRFQLLLHLLAPLDVGSSSGFAVPSDGTGEEYSSPPAPFPADNRTSIWYLVCSQIPSGTLIGRLLCKRTLGLPVSESLRLC